MHECDKCGKQFKSIAALNSHSRVHKDGYVNRGYATGAGNSTRKRRELRIQQYTSDPDLCQCCSIALTYKQHKQHSKFCSRSCSATKNNLSRERTNSPKAVKSRPICTNTCEHCNSTYQCKNKHRRFCSDMCKSLWRKEHPRVITDALREQLRQAGQRSAEVQHLSKRSKNEILFFEMCARDFQHVTANERHFNGWDADVILHDIKVAVLWNGPWHYKKLAANHSVSQVQTRDAIKIGEIVAMGYTPYVVVDMGRPGKTANERFVANTYESFKIWLQCPRIELGLQSAYETN